MYADWLAALPDDATLARGDFYDIAEALRERLRFAEEVDGAIELATGHLEEREVDQGVGLFKVGGDGCPDVIDDGSSCKKECGWYGNLVFAAADVAVNTGIKAALSAMHELLDRTQIDGLAPELDLLELVGERIEQLGDPVAFVVGELVDLDALGLEGQGLLVAGGVEELAKVACVYWFVWHRAEFDELVGEVPPGSMGLTLQPYWSPGVKIPGPEAKGAIIGFGIAPEGATRAEVLPEAIPVVRRRG